MTVSTGLTRARRSKAALALDPIPASKVQSDPLEIAELDKHNSPFGDWMPETLKWLDHYLGPVTSNAAVAS